jgi:hypothetical protein
MSAYTDMLKQLQDTTKDYVAKERTRLQNEAAVLTSILSGRTAGKGIQTAPVAMVASAAKKSIADYLSRK